MAITLKNRPLLVTGPLETDRADSWNVQIEDGRDGRVVTVFHYGEYLAAKAAVVLLTTALAGSVGVTLPE